MNVVVPGSGTVLAAVLNQHGLLKCQLVVGILEFFSSLFVVGYVCSILHGYRIYKQS